MKIKRYETEQDIPLGRWCVIDKKNDDWVCIPLTTETEEEILEIMGTDMDEMVDASTVHPSYRKKAEANPSDKQLSTRSGLLRTLTH